MQLRLTTLQVMTMWLLGVWASRGLAQPSDPVTGLDEVHLRAIHEARIQFARDRKPVFDNGLYEDYRAVVQVETTNSGADDEIHRRILRAAREAGVTIVLLATPSGPKSGSWRGVHEGVLFLAGSVPKPGGELWFPGFSATGALLQKGLRVATANTSAEGGGTNAFEPFDAMDLWPGIGFDSAMFRQFFDPGTHSNRLDAVLRNARIYPDEILAADSGTRKHVFPILDAEIARRHFSALAASRGHDEIIAGNATLDSYESRFRHLTTHVLCRDLTESSVLEALKSGRSYLAHDWLCDPTSFAFLAVHNLGVFTVGDAAPANRLIGGGTTLIAAAPVAANLKLYHQGKIVAETRGSRLDFDASDPGAYRVEAWLTVAGEERPWIYSNPIYLDDSIVSTARLPSSEKPESIEVKRGIVYSEAPSPDPNKHKLDVYWPKGRTNSPVFFFIHGGAWRLGDRTQFFPVGNRFARDGFVTVIPSYRLAPRSPYPAQIEDCASALAWTIREITAFGGDTNRIYLCGHSAGAHLAALLALDPKLLGACGFSPEYIKGVIGLSGVYDLNAIGDSEAAVFGTDKSVRRAASPITYISDRAPPFLVTYCEHEYFSLPAQAKVFEAALRRGGVKTELWYSPGENHVAEIFSFCLDADPTAEVMLKFMGK